MIHHLSSPKRNVIGFLVATIAFVYMWQTRSLAKGLLTPSCLQMLHFKHKAIWNYKLRIWSELRLPLLYLHETSARTSPALDTREPTCIVYMQLYSLCFVWISRASQILSVKGFQENAVIKILSCCANENNVDLLKNLKCFPDTENVWSM
jgi:hypothetical protein